MNWIVLSYTLAAKGNSSTRVALWRKLKRLGAISTAGGLQVLPAQAACIEAFQRLANEIRQEDGEALLMQIDTFEGLSREQVITLFCDARSKDYDELLTEVDQLERNLNPEDAAAAETSLTRLRKQYGEIRRIDYFDCPAGGVLEKRLDTLERRLLWGESPLTELKPVNKSIYQGRIWVTRPRPHVDRLSSIWLIRRFIDPQAVIRYATQVSADEVGFDMAGGEFTHHGNLCTFETLIQVFRLHTDPGLQAVAEIVHEIDVRDGQYNRPEIAGVDAILQGWLLAGLTDDELEQHGTALFSGVYAVFTYQLSAGA